METKNIEILINHFINNKMMIVIAGPTASGKTSLALSLSGLLPIEIISADSRQIYKHLDIGTAKPSKEELSRVKHHFIDILNPDEDYNAGKFGDDAYHCANNIFSSGKIPVVVGGSGLYIKALTEGLFDEETDLDVSKKNDIRLSLNEKLNEIGKDGLFDELMMVDQKSAELYPDRNPRRVLRALEYYYLNGKSIVDSRLINKPERDIKYVQFGINFDREFLYERINLRAQKMWDDGLLQEMKAIFKMGFSPELNSLNTVGYKEANLYLTGYLSEEETISEIQKNTRHYAKRQLTWFKKDSNMHWIDYASGNSGMIDDILNVMSKVEV
jgi:tRNA dimethylallyltransferase